jgi:hypothetical protein
MRDFNTTVESEDYWRDLVAMRDVLKPFLVYRRQWDSNEPKLSDILPETSVIEEKLRKYVR